MFVEVTVFLERFVEIVTPGWSNFLSLRTSARSLESNKKAHFIGRREGRRWKKVLLRKNNERQSGVKRESKSNPTQRDKIFKWGFPLSTREKKYHWSLTQVASLESCQTQFGHLQNQAKEYKFWQILVFAIGRFVNYSCKINAWCSQCSDFVLHRWVQ